MGHDPENCHELFELLSEYLDFEVSPEMCRQIEQHLEGCPPCVEFVESLRKTIALCREYEPSVMPGPLSAEARAQLEQAWEKVLTSRRSV